MVSQVQSLRGQPGAGRLNRIPALLLAALIGLSAGPSQASDRVAFGAVAFGSTGVDRGANGTWSDAWSREWPRDWSREWSLGLGVDNVAGRSGGTAAAFALDVSSAPLWRAGSFGLLGGGGVDLDTNGDAWIGLGPVFHLRLGRLWRLEASVMPGLYHEGSGGNDLGGAVQFRSRGGVSYLFGGGWLGVSFGHKSNASLSEDNPGVETLLLHWARPF